MIKVLGDLHFGTRHNSHIFHKILVDSFKWFLTKVTKSDHVIILGDIFQSRSSVDMHILNDAIDLLLELSTKCKEVIILVGNHDLYYKECISSNVNCRFLKNLSENIVIVHDIEERVIDKQKCLILPWIDSPDKKLLAVEHLQTKYDYVFGHFDTVGLYGKGESAKENSIVLNKKDFGPNVNVLSGHYHCRRQVGVITYTGAFINQCFADINDVKGYHILRDNTIEFIAGICPQFLYMEVADSVQFIETYESANPEIQKQIQSKIEGNFVKLFLNEYNVENNKLYNLIKSMNPLEISLEYRTVSFEDVENEEDDFEGFEVKSDIIEILDQYMHKVQDKLPDGIKQSDIMKVLEVKHKQFLMGS